MCVHAEVLRAPKSINLGAAARPQSRHLQL